MLTQTRSNPVIRARKITEAGIKPMTEFFGQGLGPRLIKRVIPGAQLIYCRDISDLVRFAAPIGRHLALYGRLFVSIDSNEAIKGLPGKYFDGVSPRWYRGLKPRLGRSGPYPPSNVSSLGLKTLEVRCKF